MTDPSAPSEPTAPTTPAAEPTTPTTPAADPAPAADPNTPASSDPSGDTPSDPSSDPAKAEGDDGLLFKDPEKKDGDKPEGDDPEADPENKDGDDDPENPDEPATTFDVEKLETPEDMPIPEEMRAEVTDLVKELENPELTSQEKAQKMTDMHVKIMNAQAESWDKMKGDWRQECENDPDIGGDKLEAVTGNVNDIVRQFASNPEFGGSEELFNEFRADLSILGLGNKKSFIKVMNNISKATRGDSAAGGSSSGEGEKKTREQIMYPNMKD